MKLINPQILSHILLFGSILALNAALLTSVNAEPKELSSTIKKDPVNQGGLNALIPILAILLNDEEKPDADKDGIEDSVDPDDDNDGMPDVWEIANGLNPLNATDANLDPDNDHLSNLQEYQNGTDPNSNDIGNTQFSAIQASRFLTQASFGPTLSEIQSLESTANIETWINQQFNLPTSYHLPLVKSQGSGDVGGDTQLVRYPVWWQIALHSDDQLRQRVAFALSEIMVVSDRPDALINHGNLLAAYFDILVEHASGNYRDLLEAVTKNPAMGLYLSMLGNETTNNRADENYAREVLQLFSIGLVQLNLDGTQKLDANNKSIPTYNQQDIANLAKVFTGWAWDRDEYEPYQGGWYPDVSIMEIPMKAFPNYHDTASKTYLGITAPANLTPEQDLDMALDAIYNHPNVGPFISKRLIQRLVTSNPSKRYIARVASVFNDNGQGERGDLKAVIKTILLDPEARSDVFSKKPDFGKLREPILRFSHLWRSFQVQDPIEMDHFSSLMSQHAPLTAKSVFNFFSPHYAPPGEITNAGLVAPEFQLISEARITSIYNLIFDIIEEDGFYDIFPTRLNLTYELTLVNTPIQLLDHLDLLLMSGNMSLEFRQILLNYINQNKTEVPSEQLLRDVISLIISSAQYSIQR
jgi:uncharacterized protein (DUF1800 family)